MDSISELFGGAERAPLSQSQPWAALGMSRATWYRRGKPITADRREKPTLDDALAVVKAAGYRVRKLSAPKRKNQVGPTCAVAFSDGTTVRMTTSTSLEKLDWSRGERLARQAWASRHKVPLDLDSAELAKIAPAISACCFEQGDKVLAQYEPHLDAFPPTGGVAT
jgi:hypothetical protein